jgi:ankyrin repeat protein
MNVILIVNIATNIIILQIIILLSYNMSFEKACQDGDLAAARLLIPNDGMTLYLKQTWTRGLINACLGNHTEIIELVLSKHENACNWGLAYACKNEYISIIELMISKGATDWNLGLINACTRGHLAVVDLMISKGANNWNGGLTTACRGGHMNIVQYMIRKGANDWSAGLAAASTLEIAELMISKGANNWCFTFFEACYDGHLPIIELILCKAPHMFGKHFDWNRGLKNACFYKQNEHYLAIVKLMLLKGATNYDRLTNNEFRALISNYGFPISKMLIINSEMYHEFKNMTIQIHYNLSCVLLRDLALVVTQYLVNF